ncbi:L,D-transpeptidase family protein [Roseateles sp.]|uniref:L,D-transpeptidase family protein n=1 Tax=Roseateles sp. TaxID=1971397 RepID=UPI003BA62E0D
MSEQSFKTLGPASKSAGPLAHSQSAAVAGAVKPSVLASLGVLAVLGVVGFVFAKVDLHPEHAVRQTAPLTDGMTEPVKALGSATERLINSKPDTQTPEGQLILSYQYLAKGKESLALATVEELVKQRPDFALAQLLLGDLLLARSGHPMAQTHSPERMASAPAGASETLRAEARLRLAALVERPPEDAVPKPLLGLSPAVRHAIVVDTSRARLYLFENSAQGLKLLRDNYVSIGKLGTGKLEEGDQRTPLGLYHIGLRRDEAAARYGAAALPLNYPNEYDRVLGRGGSSIWLHGERAGNYARGPMSTDGCIVLSNDEMKLLADTVAERETPVVIVENIEWLSRSAANMQPSDKGFEAAFQGWQRARLEQDAGQVRRFYEAGLERGSDSAAPRLEANLARMVKQELPLQSLERISSLPWPTQPKVRVVTYRELSPADAGRPKLKRQYWREQADGRWSIFFDGLVS